MNGIYFSICLLCLKCFQLVLGNAQADRATLYFAAGKAFDLPCRNETGGRFAKVFWYTDAYTDQNRIRTDVYSWDVSRKTFISEFFENRLQTIRGTSLRIKDSKLTDSGKYTCDIIFQETTGGKKGLKVKTMASYDVNIVGQPNVIDLSIKGLLLKKGESTNVKIPFCESQALSDFNITWTKLSGTMSSNVKIGSSKPKKIPGPGTLTTYIRRVTLTFTNFSEQDVGKYQCIAKNIGGELRNVMEARMKKAPIIFSRKSFNIDVKVGGFLECKAKGYPSMDFTWRVYPGTPKSILMHPGETIDDFTISTTVYSSRSEIGSSRLIISKVKKTHHGKFVCIASTNDLESTEQEIYLTGKAPPDPPEIIQEKTQIEENEITLFWKVLDNGGSPVVSVKIDFKNSSTLKDWMSVEVFDHPANQANENKYTIQNLVKGTSYDFQIRASNSKGESDYSEIFTLTTIGLDNGVPTSEPTTDDQILGNLDMTTIIGIFGGVFIALVIGFICVCIFVRKMQKGDKEDTAPPQQSLASFAPNSTPGTQQRSMVDGHAAAMEMQPLMMRQPDEWEFPRDRLTITTVLGAGAFGVVMRGLAQGIKGSVGQITVAVKTVRDTTNDAATKDLVAELNLLKLIPAHQNVVGLLGCCTYADPLYVIVEYCANGDLQGFLRSSRGIYERYYRTSYGGAVPNLTCKMLLTFAWQVAKGMNHLSSMKVIHRDLAARNILVDDQLVCKVSDFGFARDIYVEDHYLKRSAGGRFPIKWMAIESLLDGISTTKSDVWSFGVVFWELITLGASPYPGMNSYEVVSFLQDGYRMDKPKHCVDEIYQLMMDCWGVAPGRRPSFVDLINKCQFLMEESDNKELIDMNFYPDHLYVNFDGSNSSAVSTTTTPHGTLTRNHINNVKNKPQNMVDNNSASGTLGKNHLISQTPRTKLRSPSNHSMPSGRTNSVPALSERSLTGASNHSFHANQHPSERVGLLSQMSHPS